ncbi:hypothetical protein SRB5_61250 [Streptomyces sp. RB5]|uniref:Uncharacterized protein n=1 Tax=Streptomyces smaragdinus TaxID=2585196 RepID=A0A7K0CRG5_9ACTN|nr:hypothetical protein [Streptomyces smaragdinus]MQY15933.1 hypothetical protein [Streptomyces smaragdinus]
MDLTVLTYVLYIAVSIGLTVWVARTLSRNGKVFLADAMRGNEQLADAVNHLLVVGFYLVNLGFVALFLKTGTDVDSQQEVVETLAGKLGIVLLVLGGMHLTNVFVLGRYRRRSLLEREQQPPVEPDAWADAAPAGA